MRLFLLCVLRYVITLSGLCVVSLGMAQEPDVVFPRGMNVEVPRYENDISGGVVIDQSVTFIGQNFYRTFVQKWSELDPDERFTIVIKEHPTARYGSFIQIEYQGHVMFNTSLSVRSRGVLSETVEAAASQVMNTIVETEAGQLLQADVDVGSSEL